MVLSFSLRSETLGVAGEILSQACCPSIQSRECRRADSELDEKSARRHDGQERFHGLEDAPGAVYEVAGVALVRVIQHIGDVDEQDEPAARPVQCAIRGATG